MTRSKSTSPETTAAEGAPATPPPTPETANPAPQSDHNSVAAAGIRTEAEVVADAEAALEARANRAAVGGAGDPATPSEARRPGGPNGKNTGKLVRFERARDGAVFEANEGTAQHARMVKDADFTETRRKAQSA